MSALRIDVEAFDCIILPYENCPCGNHPDAYVDMLIFRTVPLGIFSHAEIHCDITGKIFTMLPAFIEQD